MDYFYEIIHPEEGLPVKAFVHSVDYFDMHWHREIELLLVLKGQVNVKIGERETRLQEEDLVLINHNEVHSIIRSQDKNLLLAVQIDPDFFSNLYPDLKEQAFRCNSALNQVSFRQSYRRLRACLAGIVWEILKKKQGYPARIGSLLYSLMDVLNQTFLDTDTQKRDDRASQGDLDRLQRIITYVNQNLDKKLSLKEISQQEHLSYYYLSHFIKNKMGISFQEYLNHLRLSRAAQLLENSSLSITEVIFQLGFSNTVAFGRLFKEKYGCSPSQFRKMLKTPQGSQKMNALLSENSLGEKPAGTYLDVDRREGLKLLFQHLEQESPVIPSQEAGREIKKIRVDATGTPTPFPHYWQQLIGFTRAAEGLRSRWRDQLKMLQQEIGFGYARFHGIFSDDMQVCRRNRLGEIQYHWARVDQLLDSLGEMGIKPFVELSFMPKVLSSSEKFIFWWRANVSQPRAMNEWKELVSAFLRHCINRYGEEEVATWYFEVWNEPELEHHFWVGTKEEYFSFYLETALTVKAISPRLRVGGPAITHQAIAKSRWFEDFLYYCSIKSAPLDFISIHIFAENFPFSADQARETIKKLEQMPPEERNAFLSHFRMIYHGQDHTHDTLTTVKSRVKETLGSLPEIHVTEWNASAYSRNLIHDTAYVSAFLVKNILQCQGLAQSIGYWSFTDINEENQIDPEPFHGGFGLINQHGIPKASYHAYSLLSKLGDQLLAQGPDYVITKNGEEELQILFVHYTYFDQLFLSGDVSALTPLNRYHIYEEKQDKEFQVTLKGITGSFKMTRYQLNRQFGSAFDQWVEMGAPMQMGPEEIDYLKKQSVPKITVQELTVQGDLELQAVLPLHGVELITLKRTYRIEL